MGANLTTGGGPPVTTPGVVTPAQGVINAAVAKRFKDLEDEVRALKFGTKSVAISGHEFRSKVKIEAWLKINGANQHGSLFCVDVPSFLALAFTTCKDAQAEVALEVLAAKSKYDTVEHILVALFLDPRSWKFLLGAGRSRIQ